jgi:hypothetical protein
MALVVGLFKITKDRQKVHGPVECGYSIFVEGGRKYLQIETHGNPTRKHPGKTSQTLQFNEQSGRTLKKLLEDMYPN